MLSFGSLLVFRSLEGTNDERGALSFWTLSSETCVSNVEDEIGWSSRVDFFNRSLLYCTAQSSRCVVHEALTWSWFIEGTHQRYASRVLKAFEYVMYMYILISDLVLRIIVERSVNPTL